MNIKFFNCVVIGGMIVIGGTLFATGNANQMFTKHFGGESTIELEQGERLVNVTWKDNNNLWILTKNEPNMKPAIYTYKETSLFGVMQGKVTIIEK